MQETENRQAGTERTERKKRFTAKRAALMAAFVALSYTVSLLDFPIFPATPFLKLDFGNAFILLISFLLGPIEGVIVCALKEALRILSSSSGGVGELANMLTTTAYILLPSVVYQRRKGLKTVVPCLAIACVLGTLVALLTNRYINFPLYMGDNAAAVFAESFWLIVAFNLVKTVSVSLLTMLLYKRLSNFLKKMKI
ncbi:MAG: ECF transporter S component [Clostridia bacterium]|nr:ECF transporter S component [Clostridia bacterium]